MKGVHVREASEAAWRFGDVTPVRRICRGLCGFRRAHPDRARTKAARQGWGMDFGVITTGERVGHQPADADKFMVAVRDYLQGWSEDIG